MNWIIVDEELFDYVAERTDKSNAALYGRNTFQMMEGYWPTAGDQHDASRHDIHHSKWYNSVTKVVLSKSMKGQNLKNTRIISENVAKEISDLKLTGDDEVLIFGSPGASHSLMALDAIDEYWLFINPILLGTGIPLFKNIHDRKKLTLIKSHAFPNGVVCLYYRRDR